MNKEKNSNLTDALEDSGPNFAELLANALRDKENGSRKSYDRLCAELKQDNLSDSTFINFISGIRLCSPNLTKEHETLIILFLKLDWTSRTRELAAAYRETLTDLVASQTHFCKLCVQALVLRIKSLSSSGQESALLSVHFEHIHLAFSAVLLVVPTSPLLIFETFAKNFPYMNKSSDLITNYAKNLLHVCNYCPDISQNILNLLIDNMLKIDVAISRDDLISVLQSSNCDSDTQFSMELGGSHSTNKNLTKCADLATKLDNLMGILFEYVKTSCFDGDQTVFNMTAAKILWTKLEQSFSCIILATYNCSHVQYVMFYVCSLDKALSDRFLKLCWHHIQDPSVPVFFSQVACAYLGGMLTRAKCISLPTVKKWLSISVDYIHKYIDNQDNDVVLLPTKHKLFYQLCQHVFYVVAFHHAEICIDQAGIEFLKKLSFERIIMSRLNPLRFCLTSVADFFARVTRFHQITFCYTVLERNRRASLQTASYELSKKETQIHAYFPFEPYLLEHSGTLIEQLYRHWNGSMDDIEESPLGDDDHLMDEVVRSFENHFTIHASKKGLSLDSDIPMSSSFGYEMY